MHFLCKCNYSVRWHSSRLMMLRSPGISQVVSRSISPHNGVSLNTKWTCNWYGLITCNTASNAVLSELNYVCVSMSAWSGCIAQPVGLWCLEVRSNSSTTIKSNLITLHNRYRRCASVLLQVMVSFIGFQRVISTLWPISAYGTLKLTWISALFKIIAERSS